jgi:excinuclease ABC subunit A
LKNNDCAGRPSSFLHESVNAGNTLVVAEHNLDVIKSADWIIDLGPEGGAGGQIVAEGRLNR